MKIVTVCDLNFSQASPRAFRVSELITQLSARGHQVWLVNAFDRTIYGPDEISALSYVKPFDAGINKKTDLISIMKKVAFFRRCNKVFNYFFYTYKVPFRTSFIKKAMRSFDEFDVLLSVSSPFYVHMGALGIRYKFKPIKILDCGDPLNYCEFKYAPYWKRIERKIYSKGDFICVPTKKAVALYEKMLPREKLRVIPQGIDFSRYPIEEYVPHDRPAFVYAGRFYEKIRNPKAFLDYLLTVKKDFKFDVYTNKDDAFFSKLKEYEEKLKGRMEIHEFVSRAECIRILSKADFLINIENASLYQQPSKLIDYGISKRPVLSFAPDMFMPEIFEEFLQGDYSHGLEIDVSPFDIKKVTSQFEELFVKDT